MRSDRELHAGVELDLPLPAIDRGLHLGVVRRLHEQRFVGADRGGAVAHAVLNLSEQHARRRQFRIENEGALECLARFRVALLHRRSHSGAEVQPRILRIRDDAFAKCVRGVTQTSRVERFEARALEQCRTWIDLTAARDNRSAADQRGANRQLSPAEVHRRYYRRDGPA